MSQEKYKLLQDWTVLYFESIGSTNTYLKENAKDLPHKTLIYTTMQTQGKGRLGRTWQTRKGECLCLSTLFKNAAMEHALLLPMVCAVAVIRSLETIGIPHAGIKWPNDIVLYRKKISGILCESFNQGKEQVIVCGIGINLIQPQSFFEHAEIPHGSSLLALTGKTVDLEQLVALIAFNMQELYEHIPIEGFKSFKKEYETKCLTIGQDIEVLIKGERFTGKAVGINNQGELLCNIGGKLQCIRSGEASVRGLFGYT